MSGPGTFVFRSGANARQTLSDLVMAWARDSATGEPRYIHELDADHRGAKCGCVCLACGEPLTAVNAAKVEFVRRPHFRHPDGAEKSACLVLSARAAALRQLEADGWLELPRRRMSATVKGLSGDFHEAWVDLPATKLHIRDVNYRDPATAVVTFDDGRQLRVELTGTPGDAGGKLDVHGLPVPTIFLDASDPELAAMPPDELRRRLTLVPSMICWCSHWDDADLFARAEADAMAKALLYLDAVPPDLELPADLDPALRRETVLHYEVKRILAEEQRLVVPGLDLEVSVSAPRGRTLIRRWAAKPETLALEDVGLEQRFGGLIPDVVCVAWSNVAEDWYRPLLIEVTVTNHIDAARLARIQELEQATLEIDLSLTGGRVTRDELRRLVVEELAIKRWLYNPVLERERDTLYWTLHNQAAKETAALAEKARLAAEREALVLATPIGDMVRGYLDAVLAMLDASADTDADGRQRPAAAAVEKAARVHVHDAADKLHIHGYPGAADHELLDSHGILARILTCMLDRPVGYRQANVVGVLNALFQVKGRGREWFSLYFIAANAYPPTLNKKQRAWFEAEIEKVRVAIRAGDDAYRRPTTYDRLLALLFPEMADGLASPRVKRAVSAPTAGAGEGGSRPGNSQSNLRASTVLLAAPKPAQRGEAGSLWLRGPKLDEWKAEHPEAAKAWFEGAPPRGR